MSDQKTDIVETALGRLLQQFEGSVNFRSLVASYLEQVQSLEDAAWPLLGERSIDNATGHRLDGIGQIFGVTRGGRNDTDYRLALKVEIAILLSNGTEAALLDIIQQIVKMTTADYEFVEYFPKSVYIRAINWASTDAISVAAGAALSRAASAATHTSYVAAEYNAAQQFRLSDLPDTSTTGSSTGLANDGQTSGGYLSQVY